MQGVRQFRRWLVDRLKESSWPTTREPIEEVARQLGLQPDVLLQATAELAAAREQAGRGVRPAAGLLPTPRRDQPIIEMSVPKEIAAEWRGFCEARDLESNMLFRSLLHTYLSGSREPAWIQKRWKYRGATYKMHGTRRGKRWPHRIRSVVSQGALRALRRRAQRLGARPAAVLRGLVIDLLEGRFGYVKMTDVSAMWDDPNRYWNP